MRFMSDFIDKLFHIYAIPNLRKVLTDMKKKLLAALLASALAAGMLPTSACAAASAYTSSNATLISFTDSAVTADGKYSGYEIEGTDVSITAAGTYVFSGDCDDGSITVKKGVTGVTLVLNGLTLTNADSAAITLNKTAEAALIAAAGSENTVADTAGANDENAAVKVKSGASLSLSGTGTLTACGNAKNGIKGASDAVITVDELTLNIEAADDGLSCDDELTIKGGRVNITAGGDAVKASPDTDDAENPDTTSLGSMSSVIFSSSDIKEGETYTVLVDGASVGTTTAKLGTSTSDGGSFAPDENRNGAQQGSVSGFGDVPQNSWFADAVKYVSENKLMNGTSTTAFSPNGNMSRAMLATVLYRMSGETAEAGSSFGDVSSSAYYAAAVSWASSKGIVNGTGADVFSPNASITREQLAAMLYRYAGEPSASADLSAYTDTVGISPYASKAVEWCVAKGILSGKSATRLAPQDTATRAECAAMLQRFAAL